MDNRTVLLNHRPEKAVPHPNHHPGDLGIRPNPRATGEDEPLFSEHLSRDGWESRQEWIIKRGKRPVYWVTTRPDIRIKARASKKYVLTLTRRIDDLTYSERFEVIDPGGRALLDTSDVLWLDWDQHDRLILFKHGKVLAAEEREGLTFQLKELADFNSHKPKRVIAPNWATTW